MSENIDRLIRNLSLKPRELELLHPDKQEAINHLIQLGETTSEPLMKAFDSSDVEAQKTILSLLGQFKYKPALLAIARQLHNTNPSVRYEAICALKEYQLDDLREPEIVSLIHEASGDTSIDVRNEVNILLHNLGEMTVEKSWTHGANTWEALTKAFIRLEIKKDNPDFKTLAAKLDVYPSASRHGAWVRVAQELHSIGKKNLAIRCYIEALYNDPDDRSVAWGWLDGSCDKEMAILPRSIPHTIATIQDLRQGYGSADQPKREIAPAVWLVKKAETAQRKQEAKSTLSTGLGLIGAGILYWALIACAIKVIRPELLTFMPAIPSTGSFWVLMISLVSMGVIHLIVVRTDSSNDEGRLGCYLALLIGPAILPLMGTIKIVRPLIYMFRKRS